MSSAADPVQGFECQVRDFRRRLAYLREERERLAGEGSGDHISAVILSLEQHPMMQSIPRLTQELAAARAARDDFRALWNAARQGGEARRLRGTVDSLEKELSIAHTTIEELHARQIQTEESFNA